MNLPPCIRRRKSTTFRSLRLSQVFCLAALFVWPLLLDADPPGWWSERGVVDPGQTPNDYAAVNQGQLKFMAQQAAAEMAAHLPGGINVAAGADLAALLNTLANPSASTNDYAAVNLGQLKATAKPFYELLLGVGYTNAYPWTGHEASTNDYAAANIGQVKNLFSFDLLAVTAANDADGDGIPDWWERYYFPTTYDTSRFNPSAPAPNGEGMTILQAFQQGVDPLTFYTGQPPSISLVSGNGQTAAPGNFLPAPLVVQINDASGNPMAGVPVTFSDASNDGSQLQATRQASPKTTLSVLTDSNGQAQVFFQVATTAGVASTITAVPSATNPANPAAFQETSVSSGGGSSAPSDPNNPQTPQSVPVQSYASVDVSGSVQGTNDVQAVVLNDANVVAYGFYTDSTQSTYSTYQFINGQPSHVQDLATEQVASNSYTIYYLWPEIDSQGRIFGERGTTWISDGDPEDAPWSGAFMYQGGNPTLLALPSPYQYSTPNADGIYLTCVVDSGYCGYAEGLLYLPDPDGSSATIPMESLGGIICCNGTTVIFDPNALAAGSSDPNVQVIGEYFIPELMNNAGSALGWNYDDNNLPLLWDAATQTLTVISNNTNDSYRGINNQNQVVVFSRPEGYLWENGVTTVLANHLPAELGGQISNIEPISISNQTDPDSSSANYDQTIYILATANVTQSDGMVVGATIVCTRDNDGNWSFAQIQQPDGTNVSQYVSINSSGCIAVLYQNSGNSDEASVIPATTQNQQATAGQPNAPTPSPTVAGIMEPYTLKVTNLGQQRFVKPPAYAGFDQATFTLGTPLFEVDATVRRDVAAQATYSLEQDIQSTRIITFKDPGANGATSTTSCIESNFYADTFTNDPTVHQDHDSNGNLTFKLQDNPIFTINQVPVRQFVSQMEIKATVLDYIVKQVGSGAPQAVCVVRWTFDYIATFNPASMGSSTDAQYTDLPTHSAIPLLNHPRYGVAPSSGQQPVNDRAEQDDSNNFLGQAKNWTKAGSGKAAYMYQYPP